MKQRIVLWGALAALVVAVGGLVVASAGGDGGEDAAPPRLPVELAGASASGDSTSAALATEQATDLAIGIATTYTAGDDLPDLGGTGPAYRLPLSVGEDRVTALAEALGIDGEPEQQEDAWHVEGGGMALDVYGPGGAWSAYRLVAPDTPVSSSVSESASASASAPPDAADAADGVSGGLPAAEPPPDTTIVCVTTPCEPQAGPTESAEPAEPAEPVTTVPETTLPPAAEDVPGENEAREIAVRVLAAGGLDLGDARVEVGDGGSGRLVTVEPVLGGLPAPGLAGTVIVGAGGRIESATGWLGPAEELGDYALLTTRQALDRYNEVGEVTAQDVATATEAPGSAPTSGTSVPDGALGTTPGDPGEVPPAEPTERVETLPAPAEAAPEPMPAPEPEPAPVEPPSEVVLVGAEVVLVAVPSWDASGAYLVPGYRFTTEAGEAGEGAGDGPIVPAVPDDALRPRPAEAGGG